MFGKIFFWPVFTFFHQQLVFFNHPRFEIMSSSTVYYVLQIRLVCGMWLVHWKLRIKPWIKPFRRIPFICTFCRVFVFHHSTQVDQISQQEPKCSLKLQSFIFSMKMRIEDHQCLYQPISDTTFVIDHQKWQSDAIYGIPEHNSWCLRILGRWRTFIDIHEYLI